MIERSSVNKRIVYQKSYLDIEHINHKKRGENMKKMCVHNGIKTTVNYFNSIGIPLTPTDLGFDSYVIE